MTDGLFENVPPVQPLDQEDKDWIAELVGEGKRYKDPNALAKAAVHKDRHITQLESETQALRDELKTRTTLDQIKDLISSPPIPPESEPPEPRVDSPAATPEAIAEMVAKEYEKTRLKDQRERNLVSVREKLQNAFGEHFSVTLADKAKELKLGTQFLEDLAATHPEAFLALVGATAKGTPSVFHAPPQSSRVTTSTNENTERTASYYSRMRREKPDLWKSKEMRIQRHQDALRLGEAYFD